MWRTALRLACLMAISANCPVARAQRVVIEPSIESQLSWTSNSTFGEAGPGAPDTILEVTPRVRVHRIGGRLRLTGTASVTGVAYARESQPNTVEPTADITARLEAIERLLFVEAGYRAVQTAENPFGARAEGAAGSNRMTLTQWRFSPSIEGQYGDVRYRLLSANTWSKDIGAGTATATVGGGYFGRHGIRIERDPRPLGWRLEAERSYTRYDESAQPHVGISTAVAVLNYAVLDDWSIGIRGGRESNNVVVSADDRRRSIYGFETHWQPSPRTELTALREQRFFGPAWNVAFVHRRPRLAWSLVLSRGVDTAPQAMFELPATDNVGDLIDAMFTTRFPDPTERARVVQEFIAQQALPTSTQAPLSLFSQRVSLTNSRRATVSAIGSRTTFTVSGFAVRTEDLSDAVVLGGGPVSNNNQYGLTAVLSHRLTPQISAGVAADWSRIRALSAIEETTQQGLRVGLSLQVAPATFTHVGGRYRKIESNVAAEGREGSVYVGLDHRF